jgi:hypothetical protein
MGAALVPRFSGSHHPHPRQVADNVRAAARPPLPAEEHAALRAFYTERVAPFIRGPY